MAMASCSNREKGIRRSGFTLIELSIVLVIIGLIVGGVMVGRDLIDAANLRATVSQIDKYNAAANAFKLKYNSLPGDIRPDKAAQFGFFQITSNCGSTCSYENGVINGAGSPQVFYEPYAFWRHLWQAGLISETMNSDLLQSSSGLPSSTPNGWQQGIMPVIKYIPTNNWFMSISNRWSTIGESITVNKNVFLPYEVVSPIQAYALDSKIDDGRPNTGRVWETNAADGGLWSVSPQNGNCTFAGTNAFSDEAQYNSNPETGGNIGSDGSIDMCRIHVSADF